MNLVIENKKSLPKTVGISLEDLFDSFNAGDVIPVSRAFLVKVGKEKLLEKAREVLDKPAQKSKVSEETISFKLISPEDL